MSLSGFSSPEARLVPRALCPLIAWGRLLPLLFALLCGCAALPEWRFDAAQVPSLQYDGRVYTVGDARAQVQTPDLLALNDEMREFVALHTSHSSNSRNRLLALHSAIKSPGILDMQYDPYAEGDARTVFARGRANCLSYAHLFVAMARESGLDARYQWMEIRPEWQRIGERVAVRLHVNVHVRAGGEEYVIDIDPLNRHDVAGTRQISDRDARALFHNNNAMMALA
ncbi:MAG: transglutaminase-like putative cysteine protease, partial [Halieaceae bacterium]